MCSSGECETCKRRAAVAAAEWALLDKNKHLGGNLGNYGAGLIHGVLRQYDELPSNEASPIDVSYLNQEIFRNAKKKK